MTLENVTHAVFGAKTAEMLMKFAEIENWRRGWDSNPRAGYPTRRFRGAPVTTTSVPLRSTRSGPFIIACSAPLDSSPRVEEVLHERAAFVLPHTGHHLKPMLVAW